MRKVTIVFLLLIFLTISAQSQIKFNYSLKTITEKDGLPDHSLRNIFIDKTGHLWITTTSSGITIYNGRDFKTINKENGLSATMTFRSVQGNDGTTWVATKNGITRIDKNGKLDTFLTSLENDRSAYFTSVIIDSGNNIWAGGFSGLYKWNKNKFQQQIIAGVSRSMFGYSRKNKNYFATNAGLLIEQNGHFEIFGASKGMIAQNIYCLYPIDDNQILIGAFDGLYKYNLQSKTSERIVTNKGQNTSALAIEKIGINEFLISSGADNLFYYDGKILAEINIKLNDPIVDIKKDNTGNIWLAGKYLYRLSKNQFTIVGANSTDSQGYNQQFYFGNGISLFIKDSTFLLSKQNRVLYKNTLHEIIMAVNYLNQKLYLGTASGNVYEYVAGKIRMIATSNFVNNQPDIVHEIWLSNNGGLYVARNYTVLYKSANEKECRGIKFNGNKNLKTFKIVEKPFDQSIILATSDGLYSLKKSDTLFTEIPLKEINQNTINALAIDQYNRLWFAEDGKGIGIIQKDSSIQYIGLKNGLPFVDIKKLLINKRAPNICWVEHIGGIAKINFSSTAILSIQNFKNGTNGIPENAQGISILNDTILLTTPNAIVLKNNTEIPIKNIFSYSIVSGASNKTATNWNLLDSVLTVQLNKGGQQLFIDINYLTNDESVPLYINYTLNGEGIQLSNIQELGTIALGYLKPGEYKLKLNITNAPNGYEVYKSAIITIVVPPFWYQTNLFKVLILLIFVALIYGVIEVVRKKTKEKRNQQIEQQRIKIELENKVLKSQLDPHVVFNLLNNIQSKILLENKTEAIEKIAVLSDFLRKTLDLSRQETIYLSEEITYIRELLLLKAGYKDENLLVTIKDEIAEKGIDGKIPTLLWQPLVENALKYCNGAQREIIVRFYEHNNYINGIILNTTTEVAIPKIHNAGNGLRLVRERIELMNELYGAQTASFECWLKENVFTASITISKKYLLYDN